MNNIVVLPGIGGSGEAHWQTLWERTHSNMRRFAPASWDNPDLDDWIASLDREVEACSHPPLLIAHSLACLLIPHWHQRSAHLIAGALLVAVPDPRGPSFPREAIKFADVPTQRFGFPSLIIASSNDPYASVAYVRRRAEQWASDIICLGERGHLNSSSGLGEWREGLNLLAAFQAGCKVREEHNNFRNCR